MKNYLVLGLLLAAAPLAAQQRDSSAYIVRLGTDTVSVEKYVRTGNVIIAQAVQRSPRTVVHNVTYHLDPAGKVTRAEIESRGAGDATPARRVMEPPANSGAIPITGPFYTPYELAIMQWQSARVRADSAALLSGNNIVRIPVRRAGADSVVLTNQFGEPMRAHIDSRGHIVHLHTPAYTTVERVANVDIDAFMRQFAARDSVGKGLGMLSPRSAYRARIKDANVWVDYSRPYRRGRPIWGALVPYGAMWRMGANDAAHIATDKTVQLGELTLAPGTYTLYLLPTQDKWTVVVNRRTGVSGLDYDPTQDVGRIDVAPAAGEALEQFTLSVNGNQTGGTLMIGWGTTRATIPITVP